MGDRPEPATMKVEEAAMLLGIGRQTAYDLAAQGKLPGALRLGRRIVVSKKALERFLESSYATYDASHIAPKGILNGG